MLVEGSVLDFMEVLSISQSRLKQPLRSIKFGSYHIFGAALPCPLTHDAFSKRMVHGDG